MMEVSGRALRAATPDGARAEILGIALGTAVGVAIPVILLIVRLAGSHIAQPAIEADYVLGVAWGLVLALVLCLAPLEPAEKRAVLTLWMARLAITLGFMLVYERHYLLDTFRYFQSSLSPAPPKSAAFGGENAVILLAWVQNHVLPASYHAVKVSFSMAGLVAVYVFYRAARRVVPVDVRFLYLLGLFPSIIFWSSILGKDPVVLLGIAVYAWGAIGCCRTGGRARDWSAAFAGAALASWVRFWLAPILAFPLVVVVVLHLHGVVRRVGAAVVLGAVLLVVIRLFADRLGLRALADLYGVIESVTGTSAGWSGGSAQNAKVMLSGPSDVVAFLPRGIFTALFRPLPGEVRNPFGLLAGLEDVVLLVLAWRALVRLRLRVLREPAVQWATLFTFAWASVYGFLSSQNFGAGVRFKLQILPVLLGLLLYVGRRTARPRSVGAKR